MNKDTMSDRPDHLTAIAKHVSAHLGDVLDISTLRLISRPAGKAQIADATVAFYIDGKQARDNVVVLVSNKNFPHMVAEDLKKAQAVSRLLQPQTREKIIMPLLADYFDGQSYSVLERLSPLSGNRIIRAIQKRATSRKIVDWLSELAQQTRRPCHDSADVQQFFIDPLQSIEASADMPAEIRQYATQCIARARNEPSGLFVTVEHGDFWAGNILFKKSGPFIVNPVPGDFRVIDWGGSILNGYPCMDLVRYGLSVFPARSAFMKYAVRTYCTRLGIEKPQAGLYLLSSMGRLGLNLEHFPRSRYIELCVRNFEFMKTQGLAPQD